MKVYLVHYDSFGDELCNDYFSTERKAKIRIKRMLKDYKWKKENFSIEEIYVK